MSNKSKSAAVRAAKRNSSKKTRQQGDKIVRDAVQALHAEKAIDAAEAAEVDKASQKGAVRLTGALTQVAAEPAAG